jgi:DsbC/DsbD-like thiol-disulfide interchange protein
MKKGTERFPDGVSLSKRKPMAITFPEANLRTVVRRPARAAAIALLLAVVGAAASALWAQGPAPPHVDVALLSDEAAVRSGQTLWVGLQFKLPAGWHVYWMNPGDSGEPPRIQWSLPQGFHAGDFLWPAPERIEAPSIVDYGYANSVVLLAPITAPDDLPMHGSITLGGEVHYLVCREICVPARANVQLALPVAARGGSAASPGAQGPTAAVRALFEQTRQRLPQPAPAAWQARARSVGNEFVLSLRTGKLATQAQFFPMDADVIENSATEEIRTTATGIEIHLRKSDQLLKPIAQLRGVVVIPGHGAFGLNAPVKQQ